jgi:hypothetical protein
MLYVRPWPVHPPAAQHRHIHKVQVVSESQVAKVTVMPGPCHDHGPASNRARDHDTCNLAPSKVDMFTRGITDISDPPGSKKEGVFIKNRCQRTKTRRHAASFEVDGANVRGDSDSNMHVVDRFRGSLVGR